MPAVLTNLVPPARGAQISDDMVERAAEVADAALDGNLTNPGGHLLLLVTGPLLRELLEYRRRTRLIATLAQPDNVIHLQGAR